MSEYGTYMSEYGTYTRWWRWRRGQTGPSPTAVERIYERITHISERILHIYERIWHVYQVVALEAGPDRPEPLHSLDRGTGRWRGSGLVTCCFPRGLVTCCLSRGLVTCCLSPGRVTCCLALSSGRRWWPWRRGRTGPSRSTHSAPRSSPSKSPPTDVCTPYVPAVGSYGLPKDGLP